jgi:hypothetical protein
LPHGSEVAGKRFCNATAGAENADGEIWLATNGRAKVSCLPPGAQSGDVATLKSPAIMAGVGTYPKDSDGAARTVVS